MADQSVCKPLIEVEKKAAFERELEEWDTLNAYNPVQRSKVPYEDANITGSHAIYKWKVDGTAKTGIVR